MTMYIQVKNGPNFEHLQNSVIYRVSHETWQLVNSFECLLPYTVLDVKDSLQFYSLKKSFTQIYFTLKYNMTAMWFVIILFGIK